MSHNVNKNDAVDRQRHFYYPFFQKYRGYKLIRYFFKFVIINARLIF